MVNGRVVRFKRQRRGISTVFWKQPLDKETLVIVGRVGLTFRTKRTKLGGHCGKRDGETAVVTER